MNIELNAADMDALAEAVTQKLHARISDTHAGVALRALIDDVSKKWAAEKYDTFCAKIDCTTEFRVILQKDSEALLERIVQNTLRQALRSHDDVDKALRQVVCERYTAMLQDRLDEIRAWKDG